MMQKVLAFTALTLNTVNGVMIDQMPSMGLLPPQWVIDEFEAEQANKTKRETDDMPIMDLLPPQKSIDEFEADRAKNNSKFINEYVKKLELKAAKTLKNSKSNRQNKRIIKRLNNRNKRLRRGKRATTSVTIW